LNGLELKLQENEKRLHEIRNSNYPDTGDLIKQCQHRKSNIERRTKKLEKRIDIFTEERTKKQENF